MSSSVTKIVWEPAVGAINLDGSRGKDRIILTRKGFMEAFFDEIELVGGKDTLTMVFRAMLTKLGAPAPLPDHPALDDVTRFHDGLILPYLLTDGNMPAAFTPVAGSRELTAYGDTVFTFQTVRLLQKFKEAMSDILTDRGAAAILHRVAKRGGIAVAEKALGDYELERAGQSAWARWTRFWPRYFRSMGGGFPGRSSAGGKTTGACSFSSAGISMRWKGSASEKPLCIVHQSYLEGIGECLSQTIRG